MEVCVCTWNMKLLAFCRFLTLYYLPFFLSYIDSTPTTKKVKHFRGKLIPIFVKNREMHLLCSPIVETTEIYSHTLFMGKNFVKITDLLMHLLNSWLDEIFYISNAREWAKSRVVKTQELFLQKNPHFFPSNQRFY